MPLISSARASTREQTLDPHRMELRAAGCSIIHEGHASRANRTRPALARLLAVIPLGETLVVVCLDRLDRSQSHLLHVIESLGARRVRIRKRTKAGPRAARAQGRVGGNPVLKAGDRDAMRKLRLARNETYFRKIETSADT